jgi:PAS domain S-box-containing protein
MSTTRVRDERPAAVTAQREVPTGTGHAWGWFLGAAFAGGLLYFALPRGSVAQGAVFAAAGLAVPVAIAIGIARNRPVHRRAWWILLVGWVVYQLANVPWTLYPLVAAEPLPFPSAADWLYFVAYGLIGAAIFALIRGRSAGRDRGGIVDALIITAGLGVLAYVFLIRPYLHASGLPAPARIAAAGYPLVDLVLVAAVARLALSPGPRSLSFSMLSAGVVVQLLADVGYGLGVLQETFAPGAPSFLAWAVSYGLYGAAAIHPSMRRLAEPVPDVERALTPPRRTVLTVSAIIPAAALFVLELREGDVDGVVGAVMAGLLFVLVLLRLAGVSESLEDTRRARERERARAEELEGVRERLRAAEERYRTLVEHLPAVVYESEPDQEGPWIYLSPQIERMTGFPIEEWLERPSLWSERVHPEDRARVIEEEEREWERVAADPKAEGVPPAEYRLLHRDGHTVWVRDEASLVRDERGRPIMWRGLLHDITQAKRSSEELARSYSRLEATLEATAEAILVVDAAGRATGFNRRYLEMWGLSADIRGRDVNEIRAQLMSQMRHPDAYVERGRWLDGHPDVEAHDILELRDGRILERHSHPQRSGGHIIGRVWSFRDVTEQRRTQRMLAEAQRVGKLGSWDWNALTGVTTWSDELYRLYGVEPGWFEPTLEERLGRLHPDDRERIRRENDLLVARGGPMEMEFRVVLPGGQVRDHRAEGEMTLDDHGRPFRMIGIEYDVTDLKQAQADLNRTIKALRETDAQRRRLLARLVEVQEGERSRIAADFHDDTIQVMTAVGMRLEALRTRLQDEEDRARVQSLEEGVTHAVARLRNLLFELRPRALDREGLVAAIRVYLSRGGKHDEATYQVDSELLEEPPLETRVVLYRAAQEALANARKHAKASNVRIELRQPNDGYLVRIIDDGRGFTPTGEGEPGHLGIVAMRDRVEMAGGWLRIDSAEGKGATVEFWVPGPQALQAGAGA